MEKFVKPVALSLFYMLSEHVATCIVVIFLLCLGDDYVENLFFHKISGNEVYSSSLIGWILLVSSLFIVIILKSMKMLDAKLAFDYTKIDWKTSWMAILGSLLAEIAIFSLCNILGVFKEEPTMSYSFFGFAVIVLVQPFMNEIVFREAIVRFMLKSGATELCAIVFSSLCFALAHFTLLAIPFYFSFGLILAFVYVKTGNAILCVIINIVSTFIKESYLFFADNCNLQDDFSLIFYIAVLLICPVSSYILLHKFANANLPEEEKGVIMTH